jgi:hypothetical protein
MTPWNVIALSFSCARKFLISRLHMVTNTNWKTRYLLNLASHRISDVIVVSVPTRRGGIWIYMESSLCAWNEMVISNPLQKEFHLFSKIMD